MGKSRLEAFSDGVIAIIITVLVLDLREPAGAGFSALWPLWHEFLNYILSFIYLGIYWNNHHHMLHTAEKVTGGMLWANLHLLFWLSLVPFATAWMSQNAATPAPTAFYGMILLMAAIAYLILERVIMSSEGPDSVLKEAVGGDRKAKLSVALYLSAIAAAFAAAWLSYLFYAVVAALWLVPDRRIENALHSRGRPA